MARQAPDPGIQARAAEEIWAASRRSGLPLYKFLPRIGIKKAVYYFWVEGRATPSAQSLAAMCRAGMDVVYILTGKRKAAADGQDPQRQG